MPVIATTAWVMLFKHARVAAGRRVLVLGAAGNVGPYAVQLAARAGAEVLGVGGQLTTNVGEVLPLAKARDAHEMLAGERGHARGKIVLRVE